MKVNIYETIEISDEQRIALARQLDGEGARKRQATRDEIKAFVWRHGSSWELALDRDVDDAPEDGFATIPGDFSADNEVLGDELEDLI